MRYSTLSSSIRCALQLSAKNDIYSRRGIQYFRTLINQRKFNTKQVPSPPKLPKTEQDEFEKLQKIAQTQVIIDGYNEEIKNNPTKESLQNAILTKNDIGGFSPEFRKTIPEFEGDVNPKTGEVGGPKQDPLRHGDYSFNGRVTDF
ncbi:hypothetical protein TPHA_0I02690 [Tetrapisispora phaffii CBS 4417]|uniref:Succinate dehydrogenase assembly factor 4, mitochondrial n=1 Tax=Tetrapisispora phaffii (strain ATCC 24235 / CBS 4417 / NBRC 1672 / NRRL Y-8282 / UCD 70-5) TaxID=1071381 RepID=G8BXZ2_TETPH|nr:hypothetical protein TPHA_0I02690 [Tetrapisispora phaffii CBS 4417]CCE64770.1 hypothetical protein TPHA_0I02690 [Tetrapisispora phaffii CBS 4417]